MIRWIACLLAAAMALLIAPAAFAATPSQDIHSSGPLSDIWIGNELSCQVGYAGDSSNQFFPSSATPGDCGTFLSVAGNPGQLYGPDFTNHSASASGFSSGTGNYQAFTPQAGGQSAVTGSGTAQSPFQVTTVVNAGNTLIQVGEVDRYVVGDDHYSTDITLFNTGRVARHVLLYHAGDCFLRGVDTGFGAVFGTAPACALAANNSPPSALEQFTPVTAGNHYVEAGFRTVWNDLAAQTNLPDTCDCTTREDNGAGINWEVVTLSPRVAQTFSMQTRIVGAAAPAVTSNPPSSTTSNSTFVTGSANPNGSSTSVHWEYGLDPSERGPGFNGNIFDQSTAPQSAGSGFTAQPFSAVVRGLLPNERYHVRFVAVNSDGTTYGPEYIFTTRRAAPPRAPRLGSTGNFTPKGVVFYLLHGRFVRLTQTLQLPLGTEFDALHGSVQLVTASGLKGKNNPKKYTGTFGGAIFKGKQVRAGGDKGLTVLQIIEDAFKGAPSLASCKGKAADGSPAAHAAVSSRILQTLRARARGRFRTRGRFAAGTVRGTEWLTIDRCKATGIHVITHSVLVTDFVKHKSILVRAGQVYIARA